ncbi:MAG: amidohydrolase family protein [Chitinophagaceae bacterium]
MKLRSPRNKQTKQQANLSLFSRRKALKIISSISLGAAIPMQLVATETSTSIDLKHPGKKLKKIATEEAWCIPEIASALKTMAKKGGNNLDYKLIAQIYNAPAASGIQTGVGANQTSNRDAASGLMLPKLLDTEKIRMDDMNTNGVDMHLLSVALPGVQFFESSQAEELAKLANDKMREVILKNPDRYAGLACFAPQNPVSAAKEMERAINYLKLNGFLVNSHTNNIYFDDEKMWPILEAAESLGYPLYIHPRAPSDGMAGPFQDYRLEGAIWGYGTETSTHIIRMIFGGVFDRFPKLQVVIGHMGEALPFWLWRLDFMGRPGARAGRKNQLKPSEYFQRNISITTSGVEDPLALQFCIDKIGVDRIMWAIDYPYQPTAPAVSFIESAPLPDDHRQKIAYANAERIFKIKIK